MACRHTVCGAAPSPSPSRHVAQHCVRLQLREQAELEERGRADGSGCPPASAAAPVGGVSGRDAGASGGCGDLRANHGAELCDRASSAHDAVRTTVQLPPSAPSAKQTSAPPAGCLLQQQKLQAASGSLASTLPRAVSIAQLGAFVSHGLTEGARSFSQLESAAEAAFAEACTPRRLFLSLLWATTRHNLRLHGPSAPTLAHEQESSLDQREHTAIVLDASDSGRGRHTDCVIRLVPS